METNVWHEAPATHVRSEVLVANPHLRVVRIRIPVGEQLPTHVNPGPVAIAVVGGEGRILVGDAGHPAEPGVVVEVPASAPHSVYADQALDVLVIQGL